MSLRADCGATTGSVRGAGPAWQAVRDHAPGVLLCGALALIATALGEVGGLRRHGVSVLTLAIFLGMAFGNATFGRRPGWAAHGGAGIAFSKQALLRAGVILYGLRLTVQDVGAFGLSGALIDATVLLSTFVLASYVGVRWLGMERRSALLIAAGSSICGAAAIMATEPVVRARDDQVTVAVATVVIFGTLAIFAYPALYRLNDAWHFLAGGAGAFGIYIGSTVHEVAQVVATARSVGPEAADTAVIAKMVRVMMLAPFLMGLSLWLSLERSRASGATNAAGPARRHAIAIPWFAFGFLGIVLFNSLDLLWPAVRDGLLAADNLILAMAMAALGLSTRISALRQAGTKPLLLALISFAWLVVAGAMINRGIPALLHAG